MFNSLRFYIGAFAFGVSCGAPSSLSAQFPVVAPPYVPFLVYKGAPLGPGDRTVKVRVKFDKEMKDGNARVWMAYSDSRATLQNFNLRAAANSNVPHAQSGNDRPHRDGSWTYSFIFPHNGAPTPNTIDRNPVGYKKGREVFYRFSVLYGNKVVNSDIVSFRMPEKITIVNMGDSYASGEGAPIRETVDKKIVVRWNDSQCHRSRNSGQALAVAELVKQNPGLSFKFENVACSGASIANGIIAPQTKGGGWFEDRPIAVDPQITQVSSWLNREGYNTANIIMLTIGGNDVKFGDIVRDYYVGPKGLSSTDETALLFRSNVFTSIPGMYNSLKSNFDAADFYYGTVLVGEYPDLLRDENALFCDNWGSGNGKEEFEAYDYVFLNPLNTAIRNAVAGQGFEKFKYVTGALVASRRNGMCNTKNPYFNNGIWESKDYQGDFFGTAHPNITGHKKIYFPIFNEALKVAVDDIRREPERVQGLEAEAELTNSINAGMEREKAIKKAKEDLANFLTRVIPKPVGVVVPQGAAARNAAAALAQAPQVSIDTSKIRDLRNVARPGRAPVPVTIGKDQIIKDDDETSN